MESKKIKELLENIPYINISSVTPEGEPWISPVWAAHDEQYNFYWTSSPESQHSVNIARKSDIFFVIYDSGLQSGGWGLYVKAKAYELKDRNEIQKAIDVFYKKKKYAPRPMEDFLEGQPRRLYKAVPEKFWINDYDKTRVPADLKVEIKL